MCSAMVYSSFREGKQTKFTMCSKAAPPDSLSGANFIFLNTLLKSVSLVVPANSLSSNSAIVSINSLKKIIFIILSPIDFTN